MDHILHVCARDIRIRGQFLRIARPDADDYRILVDPGPVIAALRHSPTRADLFTFIQGLPDTHPCHPYPWEWDNYAALRITTFDEWWNGVLGFKARNKAKQAEKKGVDLREITFDDSLAEGIWRIYNECPVRQGKRFPHFGMSLESVRDSAGTFLDCSIFLGAYFQGELIGFAKVTLGESGTQAGLMNIISLIKHRDKAPTNALIAQAVKACASRGIPYLVYSQFAYGNKQSDSLSDFKERNGFQRVDVPRYYVPLTPIGHLAFRSGMHHSILQRLPEPLIARLRNYRAAWYSKGARLRAEPTE